MPTKQQGFTLIEAVMFIIIVSIAVSAISLQVSQNVANSADPLLRQKAITILHRHVDQMQAVRWDETTPFPNPDDPSLPPETQSAPQIDTGETCTDLSSLDDFDDFDCYSAGITDADGFTVTITVSNGSGTWAGVTSDKYKQALISVTTPTNETLTVTLYRASYSL